jgi:hypothetical protein
MKQSQTCASGLHTPWRQLGPHAPSPGCTCPHVRAPQAAMAEALGPVGCNCCDPGGCCAALASRAGQLLPALAPALGGGPSRSARQSVQAEAWQLLRYLADCDAGVADRVRAGLGPGCRPAALSTTAAPMAPEKALVCSTGGTRGGLQSLLHWHAQLFSAQWIAKLLHDADDPRGYPLPANIALPCRFPGCRRCRLPWRTRWPGRGRRPYQVRARM